MLYIAIDNLITLIIFLLCILHKNVLCKNEIIDYAVVNKNDSCLYYGMYKFGLSPTRDNLTCLHSDNNFIEDEITKKNFDCQHNNKIYFENDNYWFNNFYDEFLQNDTTSVKCNRDIKRLRRALRDKELWALMMLDSTAKIPSGLLSGNINQLGDFDECLKIEKPIKGKYFLTSLDISFTHFGYSEEVDSLIHSHRWITSNLTDPGHRVPRGSIIYWGICLPSSCHVKDVQKALEENLKKYKAKILVEKLLVYTKKDGNYRNVFREKLVIYIFGTILMFNLVGTMLYSNISEDTSFVGKLLHCFSLHINTRKVLDTKLKEEIRGIDGIRALNAFALLLFHKSIVISFMPLVNRTTMAETLNMPWAIIGRTAIIYTDSFLLVSGFLSANAMLKDLNTKGNISIYQKISSRIFRILPNLVIIILFCTYVLPHMNKGPLWGLVVKSHSNICKRNMWRNLLFIHNYFGFENMCLTHTHQLGIDMQLFIITPMIVYLLWKTPRRVLSLLLLMSVLSTILRYKTAIDKEYSTVLYFGMPVKKIFDTANYTYILPTHRATIYFMGIGLAYYMSLKESRIFLSKLQTTIGWTFFTLLGLVTMVGPWHMGLKGYVYKSTDAAIFNAFSPISWGLFISWGIWAANNNCAGWFGDFLCWRGFRIFSKISYGVYLTQFPIFFNSVATMRHPIYYKPFMMFDPSEIATIMLASFFLAIFVEIPFDNAWKTIIQRQIQKRS